MKYFIYISMFFTINMAYAASEAECNFFGLQAEMIMEVRQEGKNMGEVIKDWSLYKELVIRAYEQPRFHTEENKKIIIQDFTNKIILECYKK
jgi:hypothetical protein